MFNTMGPVVVTDQISQTYPLLLKHIMEHGDTIGSRIGETREVLDLRLELTDPTHCITSRKGFSERFMHEEILQILAGVHDNDRLRAITPLAADLITPATAYGPRTWQQLEKVERELKHVLPTSRRGVVYVGRDSDLLDAYDPAAKTAGEMPCTCIWQFHQREGKLHMSVYMRSWDLVFGLGYDLPSFIAVQMTLARSLGLEVGRYTHTAGSGHIYDRHYELDVWPNDYGELDIEYVVRENLFKTRSTANDLLRR